MGQKVNPHGARVGVILDWSTKWYAEKKDFSDNLVEDYQLRKMLKEKLAAAGIADIDIERSTGKLTVTIHTAKPGIVIGRGGAEIEKLRAQLEKMMKKQVFINIIEVKQPDMDSQLVAEKIALDLENRVSFRRAMKQSIGRTMRLGAKGIKVKLSGRLAGAEIARSESYHEGTIPLQTIRADIDYGFAEADTTYGKIGVKVWIYKGEVLKGDAAKAAAHREKLEKKNDRSNDRRRRDDRRDGNRKGGNRNFNRDAKREGGNR